MDNHYNNIAFNQNINPILDLRSLSSHTSECNKIQKLKNEYNIKNDKELREFMQTNAIKLFNTNIIHNN